MERKERPSFRENLLAPLRYVCELRGRGVQKKDLPILVTVGLLEGMLILLAADNGRTTLENAAWIGATNLAIHLFFSLATSRNMPKDFIPF